MTLLRGRDIYVLKRMLKSLIVVSGEKAPG